MDETTTARLAELAIGFGANVQPGQNVAINGEPGKEHLVRALAESAYKHGARFVDVGWFDPGSSAPGSSMPPRTRWTSCRPGTASGCSHSATTAPHGSRSPAPRRRAEELRARLKLTSLKTGWTGVAATARSRRGGDAASGQG